MSTWGRQGEEPNPWKQAEITPLPAVMMDILAEGGLTAYLRKHGGFEL